MVKNKCDNCGGSSLKFYNCEGDKLCSHCADKWLEDRQRKNESETWAESHHGDWGNRD